ncbi:hypothetical protein ACFYXQ_03490 [Nocardia jiangxiensis]|uniref:Alpha/beta hydrolase n=1 Tax=Nocardia jiangxiensis TaxID=282685 RepID=A0ABW6RS41_9NOCA
MASADSGSASALTQLNALVMSASIEARYRGSRMASIVLVHGIAQEQYSADLLESGWVPALAGGVRASGHGDLADQLWRSGHPGELEVRMAFYGNAFLDPCAQGGSAPHELDTSARQVAEELAAEWLEAAAIRSTLPRDQREARRRLDSMALDDEGEQGLGAKIRPAANALAALKWFAPFGFGLAEKFVVRALSQVTLYLTDDGVRQHAQQQVLDLMGSETRLVIGHSLGSVVAYEALHRVQHPVALLTLGSPLALQTIVYPRLRPQPPRVPNHLTRWDNLADRDDLVASHIDLAPFFPAQEGQTVVPITLPSVDNGAKPHDVTHYLNKAAVGRVVAETFG